MRRVKVISAPAAMAPSVPDMLTLAQSFADHDNQPYALYELKREGRQVFMLSSCLSAEPPAAYAQLAVVDPSSWS